MRLTSRSLALLLAAAGVQSFAPSPRISSTGRWVQPSSLANSANELSGLLNEYKSGATTSTASSMADTISAPVTSAAPSTNADSMSALADAVNGATDAAEQAAKAAAAAMATASKVSFSGRFFCVQIIF